MHRTLTPHAAGHKAELSEKLGIDSSTLEVVDATHPQPLGRTLITTRPVRRGTTVLTVPLPAMITALTTQEPAHRKFFDKVTAAYPASGGPNPSPIGEDELLALALLYEKHVLKEKSRWAAHLALIPPLTAFHQPALWTPEQTEALAGCGLYNIALALQTQMGNEYDRLLPLIRTHGSGILNTTTGFTRAEWQWAMVTVWSLGLTVRLGRGTARAIVPFLDIANLNDAGGGEPNCHITQDGKTGTLHLVADRPLAPGERITVPRGKMSSRETLQVYGTVYPTNPHEHYQIQMAVPSRSPSFKERAELLRVLIHPNSPRLEEAAQVSILPTGDLVCTFNIHSGVNPSALYRAVRIITCDDADLAEWKAQLAKEPDIAVSAEHEMKMLMTLIDSVMPLLGALQPQACEKEALLQVVGDWEQGTRGQEALAAAAQAAIKWRPHSKDAASATASATSTSGGVPGVPASTASDAGSSDSEEEEEVPSIVRGAGATGGAGKAKRKGGKGKGKSRRKAGQAGHASGSSAEDGGSGGGEAGGAAASASASASGGSGEAAAAPLTELSLSRGAVDAHTYRLQCAHWYRVRERQALESLLQQLEAASQELRDIVTQFVEDPEGTEAAFAQALRAAEGEGAAAVAAAPAAASGGSGGAAAAEAAAAARMQ